MEKKLEKVQGQREEWQAVLDASGEGICGVDLAGKCTFANHAAKLLFGVSADGAGSMLGEEVHKRLHRPDVGDGLTERLEAAAWACPICEAIRTGQACSRVQEAVFRRDGSWFPAELSVVPVKVTGAVESLVVTFRDLTEQRKREEALRRLEKLAAVGQLASSIAHEINNPLESLTNLLYLMRLSDSVEEIHEYVAVAQTELARVTEITMQTLRFHRQSSRSVEVDMADLMRSVVALYTGRLLVRRVTVEWRLPMVKKVLCLEGEIRQVLNNLVRNAVDAMGVQGGRLLLRLHPQYDSRSGRAGVRITVADTGEGIRPDIASRLYEAFLTSKELTGTGLGLWVSRAIVEKHGGRIRTRTRRGERHGTVFSVWLPLDGGFNLSTVAG